MIDWDSILGIALPFVILISSMVIHVVMCYLTKIKFNWLEGQDNDIM
jgi:hypothetical protein